MLHLWLGLIPCLAVICCAAAEIQVVTVDGRVVRGRIRNWNASGDLVLQSREGRVSLSSGSLMRIRPLCASAESPPSTRPSDWVYLADGGVLAGRVESFSGSAVALNTERFGRLTIDADQLRAARWDAAPPDARTEAEQSLVELLAEVDTTQDALVMISQDSVSVVRGVLEELGPARGRFRFRDKTSSFRRDRTCGFVLAAATNAPVTGEVAVELMDGTRALGQVSSVDERSIVVETTFGSPLRLGWDEVRSISFHNDKVVFLSNLEPAEYRFEPLMNIEWPYRCDRNVANGPIRLDGETYAKGLGVHSRCRLTYHLGGRYRAFAATVGIDDSVRPRGHVMFKVVADGVTKWESGPATGRQSARHVSVSVEGVNTLTLGVDYGQDLDISDHADWADARLVRP